MSMRQRRIGITRKQSQCVARTHTLCARSFHRTDQGNAATLRARRLPETGWGGRIRTSEWRDQNPLPYHLATPQHLSARGKACGRASYSRVSLAARARGVMHGRHVQAPRHITAPAIRDPRREALGIDGTACRRANIQAPVPVSRAGANCPSQSSARRLRGTAHAPPARSRSGRPTQKRRVL